MGVIYFNLYVTSPIVIYVMAGWMSNIPNVLFVRVEWLSDILKDELYVMVEWLSDTMESILGHGWMKVKYAGCTFCDLSMKDVLYGTGVY